MFVLTTKKLKLAKLVEMGLIKDSGTNIGQNLHQLLIKSICRFAPTNPTY
jgi:hypothetical protein